MHVPHRRSFEERWGEIIDHHDRDAVKTEQKAAETAANNIDSSLVLQDRQILRRSVRPLIPKEVPLCSSGFFPFPRCNVRQKRDLVWIYMDT